MAARIPSLGLATSLPSKWMFGGKLSPADLLGDRTDCQRKRPEPDWARVHAAAHLNVRD
jgi:hypothetical protein